jgi:hypothetical protein
MRVSDLKQSKYLTKHDCGKGLLLTIASFQQENLALTGQPAQLKWCMYFQEDVKPLVLNATKGQILQVIFGSDNSDDWLGKKIVAFHDPTITNRGQVVGGIGIRAPRNQPVQPAQAQPQQLAALAPKVRQAEAPKPMQAEQAWSEPGGEEDSSDVPF